MSRRVELRSRRTQRDIEILLGRYQQSGMSVSEFSKREGVATTSLYKWLKRLDEKESRPRLVEVPAMPCSSRSMVVQTRTGYRVEVPFDFSESVLKRLLDILEA